MYFLFHILFYDGLSQDIEYSFLFYTEGPYFIRSNCNSLHQLTPNSQSIPIPPTSSLASTSLFSKDMLWKKVLQALRTVGCYSVTHVCRAGWHKTAGVRAWWLIGKESPCQSLQEMWVPSLGQEGPLEEGMPAYSSILPWDIPWTEEPGGLQSVGSQNNWTWLSD